MVRLDAGEFYRVPAEPGGGGSDVFVLQQTFAGRFYVMSMAHETLKPLKWVCVQLMVGHPIEAHAFIESNRDVRVCMVNVAKICNVDRKNKS